MIVIPEDIHDMLFNLDRPAPRVKFSPPERHVKIRNGDAPADRPGYRRPGNKAPLRRAKGGKSFKKKPRRKAEYIKVHYKSIGLALGVEYVTKKGRFVRIYTKTRLTDGIRIHDCFIATIVGTEIHTTPHYFPDGRAFVLAKITGELVYLPEYDIKCRKPTFDEACQIIESLQ